MAIKPTPGITFVITGRFCCFKSSWPASSRKHRAMFIFHSVRMSPGTPFTCSSTKCENNAGNECTAQMLHACQPFVNGTPVDSIKSTWENTGIIWHIYPTLYHHFKLKFSIIILGFTYVRHRESGPNTENSNSCMMYNS